MSFFGFSSLGKNTLKGEMKGKREKTTREQQRVFLRAHCLVQREMKREEREILKRGGGGGGVLLLLYYAREDESFLLC